MPKTKKDFSLSSRGLRYKLRIALYLMSILPLLVCIYLVSNYILPQIGFKLDIVASIIISIIIVAMGFFLIKEIFDRILSVSTDAKLIAAGDINHRISKIEGKDEIGDLSKALNQLTQHIREDMDELRGYSAKTTEINLEIQKRVLILSSLLQISSLISQGAKLEEIFSIAAEKSRLLAHSDVAYLILKEEGADTFRTLTADGINSTHLLKLNISLNDAVFNRLIKANKPLILDKENTLPQTLAANFYERFKLKNTLALPVYLRGEVRAILGIGNTQEDFLYGKDDLELLDIFAKQVAIALENDILVHRLQKLEIKDVLTGLYNEVFIRHRLGEEIKRAIIYQRPCAFILINIDNFKEFHRNFGALQAESALKKVASLIQDSVSEVDRVARAGDNEFAIVMPERNKRQAQKIAEDIRKRVEFSFSEEEESNKRLTVSAGVSENPLDGVEAQELINKARELVNIAKSQGKNRIL